jgi:hypothetical protein
MVTKHVVAEQIPRACVAHTLTALDREENGRTQRFFHSPCAQPRNNTGQQNLNFFVPRGKISNPDSTFNAEFKYVSSFSSSPTVFFVTAKLNVQYCSATLYDSAECLAP